MGGCALCGCFVATDGLGAVRKDIGGRGDGAGGAGKKDHHGNGETTME